MTAAQEWFVALLATTKMAFEEDVPMSLFSRRLTNLNP